MVSVISAIGDEPADWSCEIEEPRCNGDIVDVAGGQNQDAWPAMLVGQRMKLARPAPTRVADRLEERPPFPPAAERCALMWVLSIAAVP